MRDLRTNPACIGILRKCSSEKMQDSLSFSEFLFVQDELVMLCNKNHPIASAEKVSVMDFLNIKSIVLSNGILEYQIVFKALGIRDGLFKPSVRCSSFLTLKNYVKSGFGFLLCPKVWQMRFALILMLSTGALTSTPTFLFL